MAAGKRRGSAITGHFVRQPTVKRHPNTTTDESTGMGSKKNCPVVLFASGSDLSEV